MGEPQRKVPWRARAYDASRRLFDATVAGARVAFVGTWLGLLDRDALHAADELYYRRASRYQTQSYNLSGLFPWEIEALSRHFEGCRSLLLSSAGGGREVIALERQGFEVFGFECHPQLVQAANALLSQEGLRARIALGPRDGCPPDIPMCDGAIVGWGGYMLMQDRALRIQFLQELRAHVPVGGPLLLSFLARQAETRSMRLIAAIANGLRRVRGRPSAEVGDDLVPNFVHFFSEAEIAAELESARFRLVEFSRAGYPHAIARAVNASNVGSPAQRD